jgi:hypothetical protein
VELNVSKDAIHAIMRNDLGKKKVRAKFVPHLLMPEQKDPVHGKLRKFCQNGRERQKRVKQDCDWR